MGQRRVQGFTLVEVVVALLVLGVGVMALVGSSALTTRMIGRGGMSTRVVQAALARAELLRQRAASMASACTAPSSAADSAGSPGLDERWVVLGAPGDATREVRLALTYRVPQGIRVDTLTITLSCG
jgi:prepilin-type N-terminal cleavage/methylation domain-containing protein